MRTLPAVPYARPLAENETKVTAKDTVIPTILVESEVGSLRATTGSGLGAKQMDSSRRMGSHNVSLDTLPECGSGDELSMKEQHFV